MDTRNRLKTYLLGLSRQSKRFALLALDSAYFTVAAIAVTSYLYGTRFTDAQLLQLGLVAAGSTVLVSWGFGLYNVIIRYVGLQYFHRANLTAIAGTAITVAVTLASGITIPPLKWGIAYWTLSVIYLCYSRFIAGSILTKAKSLADRERVIIFGAGASGSQLAHCLQVSGQTLPVAFLDDDESLYGKTVNGIRVFPPYDLEDLVKDQGVNRILLAVPSASQRRRNEIVESIQPLKLHVQTIPGFQDLVTGNARVDDLREIDLADLMGREPVASNPELLTACISGKVVLVTGAGGSIGSELCRQILKLDVDKLLLLDICEPSLYQIENELRQVLDEDGVDAEVVSLLGSVDDKNRVDNILANFGVQTIYHAAAYKHVPIVEQNLIAGVHNNALGTYELAVAACEAKVESFVLISTDKAVRPTSVMGASKRIAEMILQGLQEECPTTQFSMVRFGNVLESSGSVVPLFRQQIRRGGPVTVTHRDIVRYFMTIQEAAELVIQAGSMAKGGDVFVLDMGQPVKILDLACRMIMLTGLTVRDERNPNGDIEIEFTGLRPGEKLFEELLVGNDVSGTEHPRIMRAVESYLEMPKLSRLLNKLRGAIKGHDSQVIRRVLLETVDDYKPNNGVDDLVWKKGAELRESERSSNITELDVRRASQE